MNARPARLPHSDFPDWLSPMLVKELRQGMRTRVFVFSFILVQILMTLNVVIGLLSTTNGMSAEGANTLFWVMVGAPVLLALPFSGLGALSGEKSANTLELIFLTRLSAWRIVFGKWFAIVAQTALFVCAVLPYAMLRYFMGEVNLGTDIAGLALMMGLSAVFTAINVGLSPFQTRVTRIFTIVAYVFVAYGLAATVLTAVVSSTLGATSVSFAGGWSAWLAMLLFGALIIALMLQIAASKIAPSAENHSAAKRLIGVAFLAAALVLIAVGLDAAAVVPFALVCCGPVLIGAVCDPVPWNRAVYRPFVRRGPPGRLLGLLLYPGWPAGWIFALVLILAFGAILAHGKLLDDEPLFLMFLAGSGSIFFPAAVTRLFFRRTQAPLPFFIGCLAVCCVFVILANVLDSILETKLRTLVCVLPPSAFVEGLMGILASDQIPIATGLCAVGTLISIVVLTFCSLPQWRRIRAIEKELSAPRHEPVA